MRFCILIAFAALLTFALAKEETSHNLVLGARTFRDTHIQRQVVYKKSSFLRKVTDDYIFDQKSFPTQKTITQIVVTDQYTNGKGGYATLTSGGPGMNYVQLHFKSQRGHGLNFVVDIYGE